MDQENATKKCPYCGEEINISAIKCKHCGEWLQANPEAPQAPQQVYINPVPRKSNGIGTAGFILAIISICLCWVPILNIVILIPWLLGFIFSFIGLFRSPRGLAITGLVLSIIEILIVIFVYGSIYSGYLDTL